MPLCFRHRRKRLVGSLGRTGYGKYCRAEEAGGSGSEGSHGGSPESSADRPPGALGLRLGSSVYVCVAAVPKKHPVTDSRYAFTGYLESIPPMSQLRAVLPSSGLVKSREVWDSSAARGTRFSAPKSFEPV